MAIRCIPFTPTRFDVLRYTILDGCGRPVYGPESTWVTGIPMSVQLTPNINEPEPLQKPLPNGEICWSIAQPAQLISHTITIAYCNIDPALMAALNDGNSPVHNYLFDTVGWDRTGRSAQNRVAVEGWMARPSNIGSVCDNPDAPVEGEWSYVGAYNVSNLHDLVDTTYGGTEAPDISIVGTVERGARWGRGPYDVQLNPGDPPAPGPWITPVDPATSVRYATVDVPPPEPTCGPRPLSNPAAPLVFIRPGTNGLEACVQVVTDTGEWVVDFGDGSPTQQFGADEEVCYQYTEEGCVNIGVWAANNPRLYRGTHLCLPQTLTLDIEPSAGDVPLDVVATIGSAAGQPTMDWGD